MRSVMQAPDLRIADIVELPGAFLVRPGGSGRSEGPACGGSSTTLAPVFRLIFQSQLTPRMYAAQLRSDTDVISQRIGTPGATTLVCGT